MNPKPGWQTSELWLALIAQVIPILVTLGAIAPNDVSTLQGALTRIIESTAAILGAAWVIVTYVRSRAAVKQAAFKQ